MTNIDAPRNERGQFQPKFTGSKAASVGTIASDLAAPPLSDDDEFVAMHEGAAASTTQVMEVSGSGGEAEGSVVQGVTPAMLKERARAGQWNSQVAVTHNRSGRVTMYKPTPDGWMPRTVDTNAIRQLRSEGWQARCGDCGGIHGGEINDCPSRPKVKFGLCPVCSLRIHDSYQKLPAAIAAEDAASGDSNLVTFDDLDDSTPESRIRQAITTHMWYKHPRSASERNIGAPAEPPVEVIANMVARK